MSDKPRFDYIFAMALAEKLQAALAPVVERILICGSLRRHRLMVADIEVVYIPRFIQAPIPESLFGETQPVNVTDRIIDGLIAGRVLEKRQNTQGREAWGEKNKLARLVKTGVPVDLFSATFENWWNYIVCRTGSADTNTRIASLAKERGWKWNPYGSGFTSLGGGEPYVVTSEEDVFRFVGLPYLDPCER